MASSIVIQICSQIEPKLVPCCTQARACDTIPLGWPKKNGSTIFSDVNSCQPPKMMMSSAACAPRTCSFRRVMTGPPRRRGDGGRSRGPRVGPRHLVAQRLPDLVVQLGEPLAEPDLLHRAARPGQVDVEHRLDRAGPGGHHHDLVGERDRLLQVVRHEDHRRPRLVPQRQQLGGHDRLGLHVERAERLVHQQDRRLVDQRRRQRHPLAHAAGELVRMMVLEPGQADHPQPVPRVGERLLLRDAAEQRPHRHVAEHRLPRQQRVGLEHEAGAAPDAGDRLPADRHRARRWPGQGRPPGSAWSTCRTPTAPPRRRTPRARRSWSRRAGR